MKIGKRITLFIIFLFITLGYFVSVSAQVIPIDTSGAGAPLEIEYPEIPNPEAITPETTTTSFPRYVEYLFYFLVWGAGILALLALIYGGFKYITAVGNPDKLKDAKDRIISALLGLAIVVGSYVILWQINPQFLTFSLPALIPMINSASPGVYACKPMPEEPYAFMDAWVLEKIYKTERPLSLTNLVSPDASNSMTRLTTYFASQGLNIMSITNKNDIIIRKAFKKRLDELLAYINKNCYEVGTAGPVRPDFNDEIENLWFIPEVIYGASDERLVDTGITNPYGAAVFDHDDFTGLGNVHFRHMFEFIGVPMVIHPTIKISSIKPFKRYTQNAMIWRTRLYRNKNFNAGYINQDPYEDILPATSPSLFFYAEVDPEGTEFIPLEATENIDPELGYELSPESMRVDGEALVVLYKDALISEWDGFEQEWIYRANPTTIGAGENIQTGFYFQIFSDSDNNLLDDYNLVTWNRCPGYRASEAELEHCDATVETTTGGFGTIIAHGTATAPDCCAEAAADGIIILSNIKPY